MRASRQNAMSQNGPNPSFYDEIQMNDNLALHSEQFRVEQEQNTLGWFDSPRKYLPPWLGGYNDEDSRTLSRMFMSLKVAAESYLEQKISFAGIAVPFRVSTAFRNSTHQAMKSIHLERATGFALSESMAASAHGIGGICYDDPPKVNDPIQLVLSIEYTRAALTAVLLADECGVLWDRRVFHDETFGADSVEDTGRLETALREITKLPLQEGTGAGIRQISHLVLVGESTENPRLRNAIKQVLGSEQYSTLTQIDHTVTLIDPVFAASRGVAELAWGLEEDKRGHGCPI
jgi:hypothetical protein